VAGDRLVTAAVPGVAAAGAVWLLVGCRPGVQRLSRLRSSPFAVPGAVPGAVPAPVGPVRLPSALVLLLAGSGLGFVLAGPAGAVLLAAGAVVGRRILLARRTSAAAAAARAGATRLLAALVAELRAGATPPAALAAAAGEAGPLRPLVESAVGSARQGGGLPQLASLPPGDPAGPALRALAACWALAGEYGVGLGTALTGLGRALEREERLRAEATAALAGARTTARLLAALPLLGVGLAASTGARPLTFLLHTPAGLGLTAAAAGLQAAGWWWLRRLERAALPGLVS
jgi:tight adherence protein B